VLGMGMMILGRLDRLVSGLTCESTGVSILGVRVQ
jgi:hypothetical protein